MSKHRVLGLKPQLRLEWRDQNGQNETEQTDHSASLGDSITSSTRIRFSVHTGHSDHDYRLILPVISKRREIISPRRLARRDQCVAAIGRHQRHHRIPSIGRFALKMDSRINLQKQAPRKNSHQDMRCLCLAVGMGRCSWLDGVECVVSVFARVASTEACERCIRKFAPVLRTGNRPQQAQELYLRIDSVPQSPSAIPHRRD
jgi:hypothetical protein